MRISIEYACKEYTVFEYHACMYVCMCICIRIVNDHNITMHRIIIIIDNTEIFLC